MLRRLIWLLRLQLTIDCRRCGTAAVESDLGLQGLGAPQLAAMCGKQLVWVAVLCIVWCTSVCVPFRDARAQIIRQMGCSTKARLIAKGCTEGQRCIK